MAENNGRGAKAPQHEGPRFRVRTPAPGFTRLHAAGLRFVDGVAWTDDQGVAAHCRDNCGYEVLDQESGKVANPAKWPVPPLGVTSAELAKRQEAERREALASQRGEPAAAAK